MSIVVHLDKGFNSELHGGLSVVGSHSRMGIKSESMSRSLDGSLAHSLCDEMELWEGMESRDEMRVYSDCGCADMPGEGVPLSPLDYLR